MQHFVECQKVACLIISQEIQEFSFHLLWGAWLEAKEVAKIVVIAKHFFFFLGATLFSQSRFALSLARSAHRRGVDDLKSSVLSLSPQIK